MTTDGSDSLKLPVIAFRGLWDKFAGPRSLGALRRSYQRGVPSLVRCGYEGVDLADAIDVINDPAINAQRLPLYLITPDGPDTLFSSPRVAHYAGTPQGRHPEESGSHGCTLVNVDGQGRAQTVPVPADAVRWETERITVDETTTRQDLESMLQAKAL